jgi:L-malate glycosyltransferase
MKLWPGAARRRPAPLGEPVKLLQFMTLFAIGGTERQVMNLARGLEPSRFDVHFACLKRVGQFIEEIERSGRPLTEYRVNRLYGGNTWRRQLQFARDLRRRGIDLVQTYGFWTNVFGIPAARLAGTPVVLAGIRDTCDHITPTQRWVQRLACRLADGIIVNAEAIKQRLAADGYDPERITVINNGIDVEPFKRPRARGRVRGELNLPADAPLIAVLARVTPVKGIEYFLEAAVTVSRRFPAARFLIVGETTFGDLKNPYKEKMERYAASLGIADRVTITGFRADVPELLAELSVSVLPCVLNEGLSNSVLESMAAGVPVVATTVGGNPEAIEDGVTGLLVPPRDSGALARAISSVLADKELAARLVGAARSHVTERFSTEQMVRRTEHFYLAMLDKKARDGAIREPIQGTS